MPRLALPAAALALAAAGALLPATAGAATTKSCPSADLRYPFRAGGPDDFGVFKLRITGGTCATAHRVAKAWKDEFEGNLDRGVLRLPKSVRGFAFKTLAPTAAQTYTERGHKGATTIRFNYVVPNG